MRDTSSKTSKNKIPVQNQSKNSQKSTDVDSKILEQLSKKMGNDSIKSQLDKKSGERDQLLAFISSHLQDIKHVQNIEMDELKLRPEWFRNVAKGVTGYALPDPSRWHECTKLFKQSAEAMCRGNLGQGKQLLEEALKKEEQAYESLPTQVNERLESNQRSGSTSPVSTNVESMEICPAKNLPTEIAIADEILRKDPHVKDAAPVRRTRPFTWWEQEEEKETVENSENKKENTQTDNTESAQQTQEQDEEKEETPSMEIEKETPTPIKETSTGPTTSSKKN